MSEEPMYKRLTIAQAYRFLRKEGYAHRTAIFTCIALYSPDHKTYSRRMKYFGRMWNEL